MKAPLATVYSLRPRVLDTLLDMSSDDVIDYGGTGKPDNPKPIVFFDISIGGRPTGRIESEL